MATLLQRIGSKGSKLESSDSAQTLREKSKKMSKYHDIHWGPFIKPQSSSSSWTAGWADAGPRFSQMTASLGCADKKFIRHSWGKTVWETGGSVLAKFHEKRTKCSRGTDAQTENELPAAPLHLLCISCGAPHRCGWLPCWSSTHISSEHRASYEINNAVPLKVTGINTTSYPFVSLGRVAPRLKDPIFNFQFLRDLFLASFFVTWKHILNYLWTKMMEDFEKRFNNKKKSDNKWQYLNSLDGALAVLITQILIMYCVIRCTSFSCSSSSSFSRNSSVFRGCPL